MRKVGAETALCCGGTKGTHAQQADSGRRKRKRELERGGGGKVAGRRQHVQHVGHRLTPKRVPLEPRGHPTRAGPGAKVQGVGGGRGAGVHHTVHRPEHAAPKHNRLVHPGCCGKVPQVRRRGAASHTTQMTTGQGKWGGGGGPGVSTCGPTQPPTHPHTHTPSPIQPHTHTHTATATPTHAPAPAYATAHSASTRVTVLAHQVTQHPHLVATRVLFHDPFPNSSTMGNR
jgi:hypothetical protein